jgi:hypothetical protein
MSAVFDRILENALGHQLEPMMVRSDIEELITNRVRKELSADQTNKCIQTLTQDMSIMCNLLWHKRQEDLKKQLTENFRTEKHDLKRRLRDAEDSVVHLRGRLNVYENLPKSYTSEKEEGSQMSSRIQHRHHHRLIKEGRESLQYME